MLRSSSLLSLAAAATAGLLPAQNWAELGDAGQTLDMVQVVDLPGTFTTITGQINADADLFLIQVSDPTAFTVGVTANFDSQLWLFDERGWPVVSNDDQGFGGSANPALAVGSVKVPGRYYLAISPWNNDSRSLAGLQWLGTPYATAPADGPGRLEPLASWSGSSILAGSYTISVAGATGVARHAVMPSTHNLSESQVQAAGTGTTAWFDADGGRFQILYEASNFLAAGASGVIDIERIMFRGEDGQAHPGGIYYPTVWVVVAATSLTPATMSSTFATNLAAPATTVLWSTNPVNLHMRPSVGSVPNNYNMVIDVGQFGPPTLPIDLNGSRPNLLVEVRYGGPAQFANPNVQLMEMQDASGGNTLVRGRGAVTLDAASLTGTLTDSPLVMGVDFNGSNAPRMPVPARTESFGAACGGSPSAFYEAFVNGQAFDLTGLRLTPDNPAAPTTYTVSRLDVAPDITMVDPQPDSIADDATVPHALGFALPMPNGPVNAIRACTNGFVWLDGFTADSDLSPSIGDLLAHPSPSGRLVPFWTDLHCGRNTTTHPNSGLHVRTDTSGGLGNAVCYVTWLNVGNFQSATPGGLIHTFQCVLKQATGQIEFRYGTMPRACAIASASSGYAVVTGFAPNRGVDPYLSDPQPRDLSLEVPFATKVEGAFGNMGLDSVSTPVVESPAYGARMFPGQTVKWNVNSVPPGSLIGVQLLDIASSRPGAALPTITAPGCVLSTSQFAILHEVNVLPGSSVLGSVGLTVPGNANLAGAKVYAQYVVLGGLFGAPDLITVASNGLQHTIGRR